MCFPEPILLILGISFPAYMLIKVCNFSVSNYSLGIVYGYFYLSHLLISMIFRKLHEEIGIQVSVIVCGEPCHKILIFEKKKLLSCI